MTVSTLCCQGDSEDVQKQWLPRVQYFGYETFAELRYVHTPCFVSHSPSPSSHSSLFSTLPPSRSSFHTPPSHPSSHLSLFCTFFLHFSLTLSFLYLFLFTLSLLLSPFLPSPSSLLLQFLIFLSLPLHRSFLLLPPHLLPPCLSIG